MQSTDDYPGTLSKPPSYDEVVKSTSADPDFTKCSSFVVMPPSPKPDPSKQMAEVRVRRRRRAVICMSVFLLIVAGIVVGVLGAMGKLNSSGATAPAPAPNVGASIGGAFGAFGAFGLFFGAPNMPNTPSPPCTTLDCLMAQLGLSFFYLFIDVAQVLPQAQHLIHVLTSTPASDTVSALPMLPQQLASVFNLGSNQINNVNIAPGNVSLALFYPSPGAGFGGSTTLDFLNNQIQSIVAGTAADAMTSSLLAGISTWSSLLGTLQLITVLAPATGRMYQSFNTTALYVSASFASTVMLVSTDAGSFVPGVDASTAAANSTTIYVQDAEDASRVYRIVVTL